VSKSATIEVAVVGSTATVLAAGLFALACSENPTSIPEVPVLRPFAEMVGSSSCDGQEWIEETGHVDADSTELILPTTCWEYAESASVSVEFKYAFLPGHPQSGWLWHTMRLYDLDYHCGLPDYGATFEVLDSLHLEDDSNQHGFAEFVTLPASPGCAFVALSAATAVRGGSDWFAYVRVLTALDNDPPSNLAGSYDGAAVNLTWTKNLAVENQLKRSPNTYFVVDSALASYADSTKDYGTTFKYWARHYASPDWTTKARVTDWSDSVVVVIPDSLIATITAGPDAVRRRQECMWIGAASGGRMASKYEWSGVASGTGSILVASLTAPGNLYLTVTDTLLDWQGFDTLYVGIDPNAGECEMR